MQERRGAARNTSGLVGSFGTIQDDEYRQRSQARLFDSPVAPACVIGGGKLDHVDELTD